MLPIAGLIWSSEWQESPEEKNESNVSLFWATGEDWSPIEIGAELGMSRTTCASGRPLMPKRVGLRCNLGALLIVWLARSLDILGNKMNRSAAHHGCIDSRSQDVVISPTHIKGSGPRLSCH